MAVHIFYVERHLVCGENLEFLVGGVLLQKKMCFDRWFPEHFDIMFFPKKLSANFGVPMWVLSQRIVGSRAMVEFDGVLHLGCFGFRWGKVTRILGGLLLIRNVDIMWRMG